MLNNDKIRIMTRLALYEQGNGKNDIKINSPLGDVFVRIGVSFYEDGKLKSFEPAKPTAISTEIGTIMAYDTQAMGIYGDSNSVKFSNEGRVESLMTSTDTIEVINIEGEKKLYKPLLKESVINENFMEIVPLNIEFHEYKVKFSSGIHHRFPAEYIINQYNFHIKNRCFKFYGKCKKCRQQSENK